MDTSVHRMVSTRNGTLGFNLHRNFDSGPENNRTYVLCDLPVEQVRISRPLAMTRGKTTPDIPENILEASFCITVNRNSKGVDTTPVIRVNATIYSAVVDTRLKITTSPP